MVLVLVQQDQEHRIQDLEVVPMEMNNHRELPAQNHLEQSLLLLQPYRVEVEKQRAVEDLNH